MKPDKYKVAKLTIKMKFFCYYSETLKKYPEILPTHLKETFKERKEKLGQELAEYYLGR